MANAKWMNHKLESRLLGEISTLDMQIPVLTAESEEELEPLAGKREE